MRAEVERCFAEYGVSIRVESQTGESYPDRAFVQPMRESDKENPFAVTALGSVDDRRWLCLSLGTLREGNRVWLGDACYEAVNCAAVCLGEQVIYWRSILRPEQRGAA